MNKKSRTKKSFTWRSFKGFSLLRLKMKIGLWIAWDCIGDIRNKSESKMWAPSLIRKVSSRRQVTIFVPGMMGGGRNRIVKPSELFFSPS